MKENPEFEDVVKVYFYRDIYSTIPNEVGYKLLSRDLIYKIDNSIY